MLSFILGRSRGFGFVTYSSENSADEAIKNLDNTEFKGRTIAVKLADNKGERLRRNSGNVNSGYNSSYGGENGNRGGYGYNKNGGSGGYNNNGRRGNYNYNSFNDRRGSTTPRYEIRGQW
jgi:RNA recognition motif-containing protein